MIEIHKKFLILVQEAFNGEQGFTAALDKVSSFVFEFCVNHSKEFYRLVVNLSIIM